jgi:hypothetical protein
MTGQAGGVAEGDAQVCFTQADATDHNYVGVLVDERKAEEVLNLEAVDLFRPSPVELIEGFDYGEACHSDAPSDTAVLTQGSFGFDKPGQVFDV